MSSVRVNVSVTDDVRERMLLPEHRRLNWSRIATAAFEAAMQGDGGQLQRIEDAVNTLVSATRPTDYLTSVELQIE